ncbi:FAD-dependent monooxygenase [Streptomyces sp. NPDC002888]|uniref:FAD-dependent monooxygenase n=1 Tax=Streptomyces sp. NPDC002888 TaxID=3364668 RepID=UPI0036D03C3E
MAIPIPNTTAVIVGAGIGGLTAAAALRRIGIDVRVHERATELTAAGSGLSVMTNAINALASLGISLPLEEHGQAIEEFTIMDRHGRVIRKQPLPEVAARLGAPSVNISRAALQHLLLEAAGDVPLSLGAEATHYETDENGVTVHFGDGTSARGDILIGADGFNSVIRRQLAGPEESRDSGYICWLALAAFDHPRLHPGYVGHYWGRGQRFGLIDIGHGRYYWWGTKNMDAALSRNWTGDKQEIVRAYDGWAEEVQAIIRSTPEEDILAVPSHDRAFLESWGSGPVTLLGDAAHPMLTSLGQGAAMAIEDAVMLAHALTEDRHHPQTALRAYEDQRRERTRAMVTASRKLSALEQLENPVARAMRDILFRVAPTSVLSRQLEVALDFPAPAGKLGGRPAARESST